ncbi:VanW family protein [Geodermatophilus sp. SYSU D00691]
MQQHAGAEQAAAPDETTRLSGGPAGTPPPAGGPSTGHGQSAVASRPGQPGPQATEPVPGAVPPPAYVEQADDTRPVSKEWMKVSPETPAAAPSAAAAPVAEEDRSTQQLPGYAEPPAAPATEDTTQLPVDDGPGTPGEPPSGGTGEGAGPDGTGDDTSQRPWWRRKAVLVPAAAVVVLGGAYGADVLLSAGDVPRNTVVAGVEIDGLSPAEAARTLTDELGARVAADHTVVADDFSTTLSPATAGIALDVDATVDVADDQPLNPWTRVTSFFTDREVEPVLDVDEAALDGQVEAIAGQVDVAPVEASIALDGTTASLVEPVEGRAIDREGAAEAITSALASGADPAEPIELPVEVDAPVVDAAEAQRVLDETVTPALAAPVELVSEDGATSVEIPVTAIAAALRFTPQGDGVLAVSLDPAALQSELGEELGQFGTPAQDATFEVQGDAITVVPSVDGTGVAPAALAEQLLPVLAAPAPRSLTAQLGPVPASFTTEQAQSLGIVEQVSTFTTNFTSQASGTNIRVVAAEVDGAIVRPGETFSLNTYTGPRGTAQGYVPAGVISGGQITQAVGGGVSQFATTMFNAVFFAGLEDVYHKPHSFYISRYPAGREATVYEGQIDLVWKNDTDTGIYVQTAWTPNSLTVTFWGTRHYEIESISSDRRNIRQPAVIEKPDDGNCTPQSGSTGFDITVTRVFQDLNTGAEIRRENFNTHYAAEDIIRCVPVAPTTPEGTAPPAGTTPGG